MRFTQLSDLVVDVKEGVPGVSTNQALQALRRSARKFMTVGELNNYTFTVTLDETETTYKLTMPGDVYIKSIVDQDPNITFDGIDSITFTSVNYSTGDTIDIDAILGYNANANAFPEWVINRYFDGIVAGAQAKLDRGNAKHYNRIWGTHLSNAMSFAETFTGVQG